MIFDTAPQLEEFAPPTFVHQGRTWVGRHLSVIEWFAHVEQLARAGRNELNIFELEAFWVKLVKRFFPAPRRRLLVRLRLARPRPEEVSVAEIFVTLPLAVRQRAIESFIASQARALGLKGTTPGKTTTATS